MPICEDAEHILVLKFDVFQLVLVGVVVFVDMLHLDLLDGCHMTVEIFELSSGLDVGRIARSQVEFDLSFIGSQLLEGSV